MKKKYIVFGIFAATSLLGFGQQADSSYRKKKVSKTTIQLVYSHYLQNGNHSAVTGGTGTEKLTVYSPDVTINIQRDSSTSYTINTGVDIISSASTDKIDFVVSSASKVDNHMYLNGGINKTTRNKQWVLAGNGYFSIESDYLSWGAGFSAIHTSKDKMSEISASFDTFFDDLRWGRLSNKKPYKLIYPVELRYKEWFDTYKRQSYNASFSLYQTINKKMSLAIFPGISYQHGLLATPFHRVYFTDSSARVEKLPANRLKIPIGIQLNTFIGDRYILRSYYRFYWDDFGIVAHTAEVELPVKLSMAFTLSPFFRFYTQKGASFFKPFQQHALQSEFYTSDYDLSSFNSYESGLELKLNGQGKQPHSLFNKPGLRYAYYKRSDGLHAHTITLITEFTFQSKHR